MALPAVKPNGITGVQRQGDEAPVVPAEVKHAA